MYQLCSKLCRYTSKQNIEISAPGVVSIWMGKIGQKKKKYNR